MVVSDCSLLTCPRGSVCSRRWGRYTKRRQHEGGGCNGCGRPPADNEAQKEGYTATRADEKKKKRKKSACMRKYETLSWNIGTHNCMYTYENTRVVAFYICILVQQKTTNTATPRKKKHRCPYQVTYTLVCIYHTCQACAR